MKKIFILLTLNFLPQLVLAASSTLQDQFNANLQGAGTNLGYNSVTSGDNFINSAVGAIITVVLGFVGLIFFLMIFVAGYQWLASGGNADTIKKSKARLTNAVIGLIIVLAAYLITFFVYQQIMDITK